MTQALAHIGALPVYTIYTSRFRAIKFLASLPGRSFVLILTIVQLDITLEIFFFSFHVILFIQVLVIWSLHLCV